METLVPSRGLDPRPRAFRARALPTELRRRYYPFTQRICLRVATISTRSDCACITRSMSLYADGISSITPSSLRHSTPVVCACRSSRVKSLRAFERLIVRPAPCEHEQYDDASPLP